MRKEPRMIIALDNGKMNLKGKNADKEVIYRNKYSEFATEDENLLGKDTFNVVYKDRKYTIGANASTSDRNEGKGSYAHIVQALTAVTLFIEPDEKRKIVLIYGESVDMYFDAEHKREIKESLEGNHTITVNGITYNFEIELVQILPEGIGHILLDFNKYSGVQYVCDIGGGTINFLTVINGRPEPRRSKSLPLGINSIVDEIISELKRSGKGDYNRERDLILQYLNNRDACYNKEVLEIIDNTVMSQLKDFDNMLSGFANIHKLLTVQPVTFIGGGSQLFKHQLNQYYVSPIVKNLVLDDAVKANVRGFYEYGVAKYGEQ